MKIKINYLLIVLVGVISTIIGIGSVKALDTDKPAYAYIGDVYWYNSSNLYTSSFSGMPGTYYKRLCDNPNSLSKSCGEEAYCVEKSKLSPSTAAKYVAVKYGTKFNGFTWDKRRAIRAGEVIYNIQNSSNIDTSKKKYVYTYMALNKLLKFSSNSFSNKYIDKIVEDARNMKICDNDYTLPNPTIVATSPEMTYVKNKNGNYFYSKFNITLTDKDKCGETIVYTIKSSNSKAKVYSDSKFQNEISSTKEISGKTSYTVYLKVAEADVTTGSSFKVTVNAKSSEKYHIAHLWKPVNASNVYRKELQGLVTNGEISYNHSSKASDSVDIPNPDEHKFKLYKLDENGDALEGAKMTLSIATKDDTSGAYIEVAKCKIDNTDSDDKNNSSCSTDNIASYDENVTYYYKLTETNSPLGYKLDSKYKSSSYKKIENGITYFYIKDGVRKKIDDDDNTKAKSIYYGKYKSGAGVCVDTSDETKVLKVGTTAETCKVDSSSDEDPIHFNEGEVTPDENGVTLDITPGKYIGDVCLSGTEGNYKVAGTFGNNVSPCDVDNFEREVASDSSFILYIRNQKNTVSISKQDINGDEVEGAELKICSKTSYNEKGNECTAAKNIDNEKLEWMSEGFTKIWNGIPAGTYYLIETTPPGGYIQVTSAVMFVINEDGTVVSNNYDSKSDSIIIKNKLNEVTISKQDITDKKELPGAKLYICEAVKDDNGKYKMVVDDNGDCSPVILANGSEASWKSEKEPHKIQGLRPGSYYLVEDKAPLGYLDAEAIVFTMNEDGTISDENGKSVKDNKIVMFDDVNSPTGSLIIIIVAAIMVIAGGVAFYFIKKRK